MFSGFKMTVYSSTSHKKKRNIYAESLLLLRVFQNRSAGEADALTSNREGEGEYFSICSRFSIYTVLLTIGGN